MGGNGAPGGHGWLLVPGETSRTGWFCAVSGDRGANGIPRDHWDLPGTEGPGGYEHQGGHRGNQRPSSIGAETRIGSYWGITELSRSGDTGSFLAPVEFRVCPIPGGSGTSKHRGCTEAGERGSGHRFTASGAEGGGTRGGQGLPCRYRGRYRGDALPLTWSPWKQWAAARSQAGQRPCCGGTDGETTLRRRASGPHPQLLKAGRGGGEEPISETKGEETGQSE